MKNTENNNTSVEVLVKRNSETLALVNLLISALNKGANFEKIMNLVSERIQKIFSCSSGATVYLLSADKNYLIVQQNQILKARLENIKQKFALEIPREIKIHLHKKSLYYQILQGKSPRLTNEPKKIQQMISELTKDQHLKDLVPALYQGLQINSVISVPLIYDGEMIGLLDVSREKPFTHSDVDLFKTISWQIASIIRYLKMQQLLYESEMMYRNIFENVPIGIYYTDFDGVFLYGNKEAEAISGYKREELIGRNFFETKLLNPEGRKKAKENLALHRMGKSTGPDEFAITRKDGQKQILEINTEIVNIAGKKVVLGLVHDITKHKQFEESLRKSEEAYRLVSENIPVVVYSALPDNYSSTIFISGRVKELTGYTGRQFIEEPWFWKKVIHPDDQELVRQKLQEHRRKKIPLYVEYRIITKDNVIKWIQDKATPMLDRNGRIIRIDGFMEDITEKKKAEETISQRNREFVIINSVSAVVSQSLNIEEILNAALDKILELLHLDVGGIYLTDLIHNRLNLVVHRGVSQAFIHRMKSLDVSYETVKTVTAQQKSGQFILDAKSVIRDSLQMEKIFLAMSKEGLKLNNSANVLLHTKEDILGLMVLASREKRRFSEWELQLMNTVGHQIAIAVENAKLYKKSQEELTERKITEERLVYQANLLENVSDAIISTDFDFKIRTWNAAAEKMYGWQAHEAINRPFFTMTRTKYLDKKPEEVMKQILTDGFWSGEVIKQTKTGAHLNIFSSTSLIRDNKGEPSGLLILNRDITGLKKAEQALVQSEKKYRNIVDLAPDGIMTVDLKGIVTSCNKVIEKNSGFSQAEIIGKHFTRIPIIVPQYIPQYVKIFAAILKGRIPKSFEANWLHKDGSIHFVEVLISLMKENDRFTGVQAIARDITERKWAEQAIKRHLTLEKTLARISETLVKEKKIDIAMSRALANIGTAIDVDRVNVFQMRAEAAIFDCTHEWFQPGLDSNKNRLQGVSFDKFHNWIEQLKKHKAIIVSDTRKLLPQSLKDLEKFGKHGVRSLLGIPLYVEDKFLGMLIFSNIKKVCDWPGDDINILHAVGEILTAGLIKDQVQNELIRTLTELKVERQKLTELTKRTIDAQERERLYLASEIHDDLLQGLVAVLYFLQMIDVSALDVKTQERKEKLSEIIKTSIDRGRALISEIEPIREPGAGLIETVRRSINLRFGGKDVVVRFTYSKRLPKLDFTLETNILRIVQEALMNVRKHACATLVSVRINVFRDSLKIEIKDNGIGFEPAIALKKPIGHYGLFTMKERARFVNGDLTISSKPGKGTIVTGIFPLSWNSDIEGKVK